MARDRKLGEDGENYTMRSKSFVKKVKQSLYTPWRRLGWREGIAPTHSRPRH
jgi:hypothetical protein